MSSYTGSLTTPPCAEGLQFFVTTEQLPIDVATFNKIKSVVGFNARFTQNTPGQDNLLSAAARQIQGAGAVVPPVAAVPSAAPVAEEKVEAIVGAPAAAPVAAPVQSPHVVVEKPAAPVAAPVAAPIVSAPVVGGAHVIGGGKITPEMAKLIKAQTGIDVPVSAKKSRKFRA